jgi:Skp family chaperone for outer membrane proteins
VVKKLAEERKGKFVLDYDPRVVIYASDRIQITEEVLERLDEMKIDS